MSKGVLDQAVHPKSDGYVYANAPLVHVYQSRDEKKKKEVATLLLGEWMAIQEPDGKIPPTGRVAVRYRGGKGYVSRGVLTPNRQLEVYLIDVGKGDSILIQTPDDRRVLIDGGDGDDAFQFICNKYRLDKPDNHIDFEAVIATHSDSDHTAGLLKVLQHPRIAVKRFYHNGLFRRMDKKQDPGPRVGDQVFGLVDRPKPTATPALTSLMKRLLQAIEEAERNLPGVLAKMRATDRWKARTDLGRVEFVCKRLDAADGFVPPFDGKSQGLKIQVLWPCAAKEKGQLSYRYYEDPGKTVNGNSIALRVSHGEHSILLAGDLNEPAMADILKKYPASGTKTPSPLQSDVYKAAHHGSQHFSVPFLQAVEADAAVISSGDDKYDEYGHPRSVLMGTVTRYARCEKPAVFCTELAACFTKLPPKMRADFKAYKGQLYERSIRGIVHLRSDGKRLLLGTVFGRRTLEDPLAGAPWKWDIWPDDRPGSAG